MQNFGYMSELISERQEQKEIIFKGMSTIHTKVFTKQPC